MTGERHVLVIANETAAGEALSAEIRRRAESGPVRVTVLAPVTQPSQGYVVYQDTRRAAAGRRLDKTVGKLREAGIPAQGLVVEADPVDALRDAIHQLEPDEVIVSTHPEVVDLAAEHGPSNVLVVANQTVLDEPLLALIRERAARSPASFLIISPQGQSDTSYDEAERRLRCAVALLRSEAIDAHGQISHPDPYQAVMEAVEDERIDELVVSTFPGERSGWLRQDLVERLRKDTNLPIEHVESEPETTGVKG